MSKRVTFDDREWLRLTMGMIWILNSILLMLSGINCQKDNGGWQKLSGVESRILERIGVSRGICVVIDDINCDLSLQLAQKSELVIFVQMSNGEDVEKARQVADSAGFYGIRIYVEKGSPNKIHLADNIADALVALSDTVEVTESEILRVLRPQGKALLKDKELVKEFPENVDEWSHPYHTPDNNTQSKDQVARAPYLTQFLAEPYYGPVTQVAVASAGRVFKGFGNVAFHEREEPFLNTLVAFNGYNGTMLWKRDMVPGIMLHRNTMIATPTTLYVGDDKSCKLLDPETGQLKGEIIPDLDIAGGTHWKWMGMENGVLYALIGEQEQKDPVMRWRRKKHGWPWTAISKGFNQVEHSWGFGRNFLAINPESGKVLWHYSEEEAIDSRAVCMKNGRIYLFRFGSFLICLDANSGKTIWKKTSETDPDLFAAIGEYLPRQSWETNWRTRNYLLCSDEALYFAGPQIDKLLALSTEDGSILWQHPFNNFQLVLRDDGLYAISGPWRTNVSKKFDPLTGEILAELPTGRRACTRPNATADAIFFRASGGTVRFDLASYSPQWISPMRPPCHDGVTIANGLLYWWPYVCDCQLSIYGVISLGPAGDFAFNKKATEEERLEKVQSSSIKVTSLLETPEDWPTFRKNNQGTVSTKAAIAKKAYQLWRFPREEVYYPATDILGHAHYTVLTAPVTVDGVVFYGSSDGSIRALDMINGTLLWKAYTGGAVRFPPTVWKGRVLVGSGDGYVYSFEARSGNLLWRFRVAPEDRKIPVYGSLLSTWPAASGILVEDGIAYVSAGIVNYDGTHVYALDAETGAIKWQNNSSGHLLPEARTGVSVQGHMLIHDKKLHLASGTSLSPAIYNLTDGNCLNDSEHLKNCESFSPRGWELYLIGDHVVVAGKPFYSHPKHKVYDETVTNKIMHNSSGRRDILWVNQKKVLCYPHINRRILNESVTGQSFTGYRAPIWGNLDISDDPYWEYNCEGSVGLAVCKNAVVVAEKSDIVVLDIRDGKILWSQPLDYSPVPWGLAVSRDGRVIVALEDGSVRCFGGKPTIPIPYVSSRNTYFVDKTNVVLACDTEGTEIRYTLDGSEPTQESKLYTRPFTVDNSLLLKMRAFSRNYGTSFIINQKFRKVEYAKAIDPGKVELGLEYDFYPGSFTLVSDLDSREPTESGYITHFKLQPPIGVNQYGYIYRGFILIPADGIYTFHIESNDGSKLYINNEELIDNDGGHGAVEKSGKLALKAGEYPIMVKYFQMGSAKALRVSWQGPGIDKEEITAEVLFHKD